MDHWHSIVKNGRSKQSRQGEECGHKVEAGILDVVRRRQEKWRTDWKKMNDGRTTKQVFKGELEGKRPRGRLRRRWIVNIK